MKAWHRAPPYLRKRDGDPSYASGERTSERTSEPNGTEKDRERGA